MLEFGQATYIEKQIFEFIVASSPPILCLEQIVSPSDPQMAQLFVNMPDMVAYVNWFDNKTKAKYNLYEGECFVVVQE
jgi:hypothetical protein